MGKDNLDTVDSVEQGIKGHLDSGNYKKLNLLGLHRDKDDDAKPQEGHESTGNEDEDIELTPVSYDDVKSHIQMLSRGFESLQSSTDMCVGLESISGFFKSTVVFFTQGLQNFADGFLAFLSSPFSSGNNNPLPQFKDYESARRKILGLGKDGYFNKINKVWTKPFPYIAGCNKELTTVTDALVSVMNNHVEIIRAGLSDVNAVVSQGISDEAFRKSNSPYKHTPAIKEMIKFTDSIKNINKEMIGSGNYTDSIPAGEMLPNYDAAVSATENLNKLHNGLSLKTLPRVDDEVKAIAMKSKSLAEDIKNNKLECSKQFLNTMKDVLLAGGEAVTYLATYYYLVSQSVNSYKYFAKNI